MVQPLTKDLEQRIFNAVLERICVDDSGLSDTNCSWCGGDKWGILAITRLYTLSGKRTIPCVAMTCAGCGNILQFDLKTLGFEDIEALLTGATGVADTGSGKEGTI